MATILHPRASLGLDKNFLPAVESAKRADSCPLPDKPAQFDAGKPLSSLKISEIEEKLRILCHNANPRLLLGLAELNVQQHQSWVRLAHFLILRANELHKEPGRVRRVLEWPINQTRARPGVASAVTLIVLAVVVGFFFPGPVPEDYCVYKPNMTRRPRDCSDLLKEGCDSSGIYTIYPFSNDVQLSGKSVGVFCDMDTDGGGWTVFQRRQDGSKDFYRGWADYKAGFGKLDGEFWLGNDKLHQLTSQAQYELRVDLEDFEGNSAYAQYQVFTVGSEDEHYRLIVGRYTGTAGDSFDSNQHNGRQFSTKDRDYDEIAASCAQAYKGGWWYGKCHDSNLNGLYHGGPHTSYADGVNWRTWKGQYYSLKNTEMKIRPITN